MGTKAQEQSFDEQAEQWNKEAEYMDDDDSILDEDPGAVLASRVEESDEEEPDEEEPDEEESDEEESDEEESDEEESDEEEPDEEEPDEEEPGEEEPDEEEPKSHMIPKSRYDSVKSRLDKALDELDSMKKSNTTGMSAKGAEDLTSKLDDVASKLNEALASGDLDTANKLHAEERKLTEQVFEMKAQSIAAQQVEQLRYQDYVTKIEEEYPELNEDDGRYSKDLSREVVDLLEAFEARGYRPVDALKRAVGYVFPDGPTAEQQAAETVDDPGAKRRAKSLRKNVAAAKKQPPRTKGKGVDSDKAGPRTPLSLIDLDDEAFDELDLDSEEMRKARGDYL
jgi:hypothetical protein